MQNLKKRKSQVQPALIVKLVLILSFVAAASYTAVATHAECTVTTEADLQGQGGGGAIIQGERCVQETVQCLENDNCRVKTTNPITNQKEIFIIQS